MDWRQFLFTLPTFSPYISAVQQEIHTLNHNLKRLERMSVFMGISCAVKVNIGQNFGVRTTLSVFFRSEWVAILVLRGEIGQNIRFRAIFWVLRWKFDADLVFQVKCGQNYGFKVIICLMLGKNGQKFVLRWKFVKILRLGQHFWGLKVNIC